MSSMDRRATGDRRGVGVGLWKGLLFVFLKIITLMARAQFIEVWRQKENALQTTKLTNLLLSNASHEGGCLINLITFAFSRMYLGSLVRTPLNHIIKCVPPTLGSQYYTQRFKHNSYLEMALNGPLDGETRDNLSRSHIASKVRPVMIQ
jgi:hypothetical protein